MADRLEADQETTGRALSTQASASHGAAPKRPRRTEITVELNQVVVIRKPEGLAVVWCHACEERVNMITTEAAAVLSDVDTRAIYRRIEAGTLHFAESPGGLVLVCLNSLVR